MQTHVAHMTTTDMINHLVNDSPNPKTILGTHFVVEIDYPKIVIRERAKYNRKVICDNEKHFEDTLLIVYKPFGLDRSELFKWALENSYLIIIRYLMIGLVWPKKVTLEKMITKFQELGKHEVADCLKEFLL